MPEKVFGFSYSQCNFVGLGYLMEMLNSVRDVQFLTSVFRTDEGFAMEIS